MRFSNCGFLISLLAFVQFGFALRFEIESTAHNPPPKCIRDFVQEGQLVVVTVDSSGHVGDGQVLSLRIVDGTGNEYRKTKDVAGKVKVAFAAHSNGPIDICFENQLQDRNAVGLKREIELELEAGAAARDWNSIQASEKLKPLEVQFRQVEEMTGEIVGELNYLVQRERRLRDTNESTNRRVRNFSISIILLLVGVGVWQIQYLRNYFRSKHIL
ncbi:unnamed protein product [Kuraishia capsulata CBS 1993]|uniref:GOLD domain-containing protein n=1 Tax=Kuraishia capsulata CBS 1993 TaxID=1382522 RepID=W6MXK1_9ASCO|nr:uncharacterized protein KUCA_T00005016001 [Kuraishia capsulata CBS 1993]CDK29030.1 unnamed protein product [Kuraishia capsulata CBS 1993]